MPRMVALSRDRGRMRASARSTMQGALQTAIDAVIAENPDAVADVRAGKQQAIGFLTGPGDGQDTWSGERRGRQGPA